MSALLIGAITVLVILILWILELKWHFRSITHLPGPKRSFPFGNTFDLCTNPTDLLEKITNYANKYGKYVQVWIGPNRPYLWISDVKFLEYILSSTRHINKSKESRYLHDWLGDGLIVGEGQKWNQHRKIITPSFHHKILEQFVDTFNKSGDNLIEKLSKEVEKEFCDVYPLITLYTLDCITETALGTCVQAQLNPQNEYVQAFRDLHQVLNERTFSKWKRYEFLFKFTNLYQKQKRSLRIVHDLSRVLISLKKKEMLKERELSKTKRAEGEVNEEEMDGLDVFAIKKRLAFVDLIMRTTYNGQRLSEEDIREEVDTFIFEGNEPMASAISFTLYAIATHPEIQTKLINEQLELFEHKWRTDATYENASNMKYLELVIKETLRLYPSVPFYSRQLNDDLNFEGLKLPKGLTVTLCPFIMHRNPELFPEPELFKPERFLQEAMKQRSPYAYMPFSAGPRNCIGQKFAMTELKIIISKILRNFELHSVPNLKLKLATTEKVLKSENGICIKLLNRNVA